MSGQASPEAMDRMITNITKFIEFQKVVAQALQRDYIAIGEEWNDKQYQELGEVIREALIAIQGSYATLSNCNVKILVLKTIYEQYLSTRIE